MHTKANGRWGRTKKIIMIKDLVATILLLKLNNILCT
uniref:Uncharacterized protein n=1 Tax=Arundo donax TaxID=35708 RepID=A0A0A9A4L0_ARUDO